MLFITDIVTEIQDAYHPLIKITRKYNAIQDILYNHIALSGIFSAENDPSWVDYEETIEIGIMEFNPEMTHQISLQYLETYLIRYLIYTENPLIPFEFIIQVRQVLNSADFTSTINAMEVKRAELMEETPLSEADQLVFRDLSSAFETDFFTLFDSLSLAEDVSESVKRAIVIIPEFWTLPTGTSYASRFYLLFIEYLRTETNVDF